MMPMTPWVSGLFISAGILSAKQKKRSAKRHTNTPKRPMNKIWFKATYPGLQKREGKVDCSCVRGDWGL